MRLPRIKKVTRQIRNRDARENLPVDERRWKSRHAEAQGRHEQELHEVVERDGAKAVHIAAGEEFHADGPCARVFAFPFVLEPTAGPLSAPSSFTTAIVNNAACREAKGESFR